MRARRPPPARAARRAGRRSRFMDDVSNRTAKPVAAKSIDPAALDMLAHADECGIETAFSRADAMKPCPIGESGACCRICSMGPCRLVGKDAEEKTGICGADMSTIATRHLPREVARGDRRHVGAADAGLLLGVLADQAAGAHGADAAAGAARADRAGLHGVGAAESRLDAALVGVRQHLKRRRVDAFGGGRYGVVLLHVIHWSSPWACLLYTSPSPRD